MLNFLPQKNKNRIIFEYILRINVLLLIFLFISSIFLSSLFLPSYFFAKFKKDTVSSQLTSIKEKNVSKGDDPIIFIKNLNRLSAALSNTKASDVKNSDIINKIVSLKNNDIKISSITIEYDTVGNRKVSISGFSKLRDSLTSFEKDIRIDGFFKSASFPVSNYIKSLNSDFSAILTI